MRKRLLAVSTVFVLLAGLVVMGCSKDDGGSTPTPTQNHVSISQVGGSSNIGALSLTSGQSVNLSAYYDISPTSATWTATQGTFSSTYSITTTYTAGSTSGQITAAIDGLTKTIPVTVTAPVGIQIVWHVTTPITKNTPQTISATVTDGISPYGGTGILWTIPVFSVGALSYDTQIAQSSVTVPSDASVTYQGSSVTGLVYFYATFGGVTVSTRINVTN
jgi:hypothetical protein